MKILVLAFLFFVAGTNSAVAADFEKEGWPGEGIPGFAAKNSELRLNKLSSKESEEITLPFRIGERITYDQSKMITKKSVTLTAKEKVTKTFCPGMPVPVIGQEPIIQPGETIEYLQYRAEGYVTARYKGVICEVFVADNNPKFDGLDKKPDVEWWIRVVNDKKVPLGWLLINEDQVNYLQRNL
jgi:hypothetical protein